MKTKRRTTRRVLAALMAVAVVCTSVLLSSAVTTVSVNNFTDIKGHWSEDAMRLAINNGLISGRSETKAEPNGAITRAELAAIMMRAFGGGTKSSLNTFVDVNQGEWYYDELARAVSLGFISGSENKLRPNDAITREEAASVVARAFGFVDGSSSDYAKFSDAGKVSSWASTAVGGLAKRGILKGSDGKLNPQASITRGEFATMMANIVQVYCNSATLPAEQSIKGNVLISYGGTELKGKTINGDVFLTEGIGSKGMTLNNTAVTGTVYIRTSGTGALNLSNGSSVSKVVVMGTSTGAGIVADKTSSVGNVSVTGGTGTVSVSGSCDTVDVSTSRVAFVAKDAEIKNINVGVANADVTVDGGSDIDNIVVSSGSGSAKVSVLGTVNKFTSNANRADITLNGDITSATVSGSDVTVTTGSNAKVGSLKLTCTNSKAILGGTLSGLDFENSKSLTVEFQSDLKLDEYVVSSSGEIFDGYKDVKIGTIILKTKVSDFKFGGNAEKIVLQSGAEGSKISFTGGTTNKVECDAKNATIVVNSGSTVKEIVVTNSGVRISGSGKVNSVTAEGNGDNLRVNTSGTKVYNDGCSNVTAGGSTVPNGSSVTTSGSGNGSTDIDDDSDSGRATYRLIYNSNYGDKETQTYNYIYGREIELPDPDSMFPRSGYKATGWAISSVATEAKYSVGQTIKMPAYTTTLYAIWEKEDSGNSGSSGGTVDNSFTIKLPSDAYPADLSEDSQYTIDMFSNAVSFEKMSDTEYKVTGSVKIVEGFGTASGSGDYFLPVVLPTPTNKSSITLYDCGDFGMQTFGVDDVVKNGIKYNGRLIAFVNLNPDGRKLTQMEDGYVSDTETLVENFKIAYNSDLGNPNSKTNTVTFDFSELSFEPNPESSARIASTLGAPLIENGVQSESKSVSVDKVVSKGYNKYTATLRATGLVQSEYNGQDSAYWVGIRLKAPENGSSLSYGIGRNVDTNTNAKLVTVGNTKYAEIYVTIDQVNGVNELGKYITFVWKDNSGYAVTPTEEMFLNFSAIATSGQSGDGAVDEVSIDLASKSPWVSSENSGKTFATYVDSGYKVDSEDSSWMFNFDVVLKSVGGKYYIPLDFKFRGDSGQTLAVTDGADVTITLSEGSDGVYTGHTLLEVSQEILDKDYSVNLSVSADGKDSKGVQLNIRASKSDSFFELSDFSDFSGKIYGKDLSDIATGYKISDTEISATLKHITNWEEYSLENNTGYFVPIRIKVNSDAPEDWSIKVDQKVYTKSDLNGDSIVAIVPVNISDSTNMVTVVVEASTSSGSSDPSLTKYLFVLVTKE